MTEVWEASKEKSSSGSVNNIYERLAVMAYQKEHIQP